MHLTKPNQDLRGDLKDAAALFKWSGVDLMKIAIKLSEAGLEAEAKEILVIISAYPEVEDRLKAYAEEINVGRITRAKE